MLKLLIIPMVYLLLAGFTPSANALAFQACQGGGCNSTGGRGGAVIEVTTLDDSGVGSLRACAVSTIGARICVFRVSGTITLLTPLIVTNPLLTIAGQTSPKGILLKISSGNILEIATNNVIVSYLRFRKGTGTGCANSTTSTACGSNIVLSSGAFNIVLDHNSLSWNQKDSIAVIDSVITSPRIQSNTLSYNLIAEGLTPFASGMLMTGSPTEAIQMTNIDIHHSLFMNNSLHNPTAFNGSTRFVNNLSYNNKEFNFQGGGGVDLDIISNIWKQGPMTNTTKQEIALFASTGELNMADGWPSVYLLGNKGWGQTDSAGYQWLLATNIKAEDGASIGSVPFCWIRSTPLASFASAIVAESVSTLESTLLPLVGASRRLACNGTWVNARDSVDTRLVDQYTANTGISVPLVTEPTNGYPTITTKPPCVDTDHDGMPNIWEKAFGLNPNSKLDSSQIDPITGLTMIEVYLGGR